MKVFIGIVFGYVLGSVIMPSNAHAPCERDECGWEEVVNPITAELEQVYVCK